MGLETSRASGFGVIHSNTVEPFVFEVSCLACTQGLEIAYSLDLPLRNPKSQPQGPNTLIPSTCHDVDAPAA